MNIFYLNSNPILCAREHCDKHIIKMTLEYAQILSTAHRVLDGESFSSHSIHGTKVTRYKLSEPYNGHIYQAVHVKHPSVIWTRQSSQNYDWLFQLFVECCFEYTRRYEKIHKSQELKQYLIVKPHNILNHGWYEPPPAMPEKYKVPGNSILSYRNYYIGDKKAFATWKEPAKIPDWFIIS